jgi:hypothetical protein
MRCIAPPIPSAWGAPTHSCSQPSQMGCTGQGRLGGGVQLFGGNRQPHQHLQGWAQDLGPDSSQCSVQGEGKSERFCCRCGREKLGVCWTEAERSGPLLLIPISSASPIHPSTSFSSSPVYPCPVRWGSQSKQKSSVGGLAVAALMGLWMLKGRMFGGNRRRRNGGLTEDGDGGGR